MEQLPPDVIRYIAQMHPDVYARMASTNSRYRETVRPMLQQVCQAPISGTEFEKLVRNPRRATNYYNLKRLTNADDNILITYNRGTNRISLDINLNNASKIFDLLLKSGYAPTMRDLNKIYGERRSCLNLDPNYNSRRLILDFHDQANQILTSNLEVIYKIENLDNLVGSFGKIFNENYELPDEYVNTDDDEEALALLREEANNLIQRANELLQAAPSS